MNIGAVKKLPLWASVVLNMLIALVAVALVQGFLVKAYRIPSGSMEPTLQGSAGDGDRTGLHLAFPPLAGHHSSAGILAGPARSHGRQPQGRACFDHPGPPYS